MSIHTVRVRKTHGRNGGIDASLRRASKIHYMHVQRGDPLIGALATTSAATVGAIWIAGPSLLLSLALFLQLAAALAFCSSVIELTNNQIVVRYGAGWIKRRIPLEEIISCRVVISVFAYGWGVRREARGYSYRRSRSLAVELYLRNGRRARIGTNRPLELVNAILLAAHHEPIASSVRASARKVE